MCESSICCQKEVFRGFTLNLRCRPPIYFLYNHHIISQQIVSFDLIYDLALRNKKETNALTKPLFLNLSVACASHCFSHFSFNHCPQLFTTCQELSSSFFEGSTMGQERSVIRSDRLGEWPMSASSENRVVR